MLESTSASQPKGSHYVVLNMSGAAAVAALVLVSWACGGGGSTPSSPSPTPPQSPTGANLAGTWSGPASDSSGPGAMSWQLTQTDTSFSGTATVTDTATGISARGSVSGTTSGSSIHFSVNISAGGFDNPFASCTASISGDGQVSGSTVTGSYSGSNSCSGAISSGQLTLTRQ
jgi:hypothetical protein